MAGDEPVFVLLLKNESLWVEECSRPEVFMVAKQGDAGICGVFADIQQAQEVMASLRTEQRQLWKPC